MKRWYIVIAILVLATITVFAMPSIAFAVPYSTETVGPEGSVVPTQTAYSPAGRIAVPGGDNPEDMAIDEASGLMYVADSGAKRVVVLNMDGEQQRVIGEGVLASPMGVALDDDRLYVADRENRKIYVYSKSDYTLLSEIGKPDNPLVGADTPFVPMKLTVDRRGNLYVVSEGCASGLMQLSLVEDAETGALRGDFIGYVGANETQATFQSLLQNLFFSDKQKSTFLAAPRSPSNVTINSRGLIYTVTNNAFQNTVKKLNTLGNAIMSPSVNYSTTVAVSVDDAENIYSVTSDGYIAVFDSYGDLLFRFGGTDPDERLGSLSKPVAIEVLDDGALVVLDQTYDMAIVYQRTEFASKVFDAVSYYKDGLYLEGEDQWKDILRLNSSFIVSYKALARASMKRGDYKTALNQFKLAEDKEGYSEAYWEIRNEWLQHNIGWIVAVILVIVALIVVWKILDKKKPKLLAPVKKGVSKVTDARIVRELLYTKNYFKSAPDAVYQTKYHSATSIWSALILYVWFVILQLLNVIVTGYLFNNNSVYNSNALRIVLTSTAILFALVLCNYFVSTVTDGEGKLKYCFITFIYALAPYLILALPMFIISRFLTYNEQIIYDLLMIVIYGWSAVCIFRTIMELHDYTFWQAIKNIILTLFAFVMAILFVIVLRMLLTQFFGYFASLFKEIFTHA